MKSRSEKGNAPEVAATEASSVKNQSQKGINMSNSTALTVAGTSVRQMNGLYSLNDLHKAAGSEARHKPSEWLRNQQAQELVSEIQIAGIPAITTKPKVGNYACKELVIAYAAWISAAFHLKVIRVFLDAVQLVAPSIDYTRISPAQAQDLKQIVQAIVETGIQGHGETWARLQRKFKVNSYLQLPFTRYEEVRKYLIDKLPAGYAGDVVEDEAKTEMMDHALIESAMAAANAVASQIQQTAFMAMMKAQSLQRGRWMVSFGYGTDPAKPSVKPVNDAAHVATMPEMVKRIQDPSTLIESQDLMDLAKACMNRLAPRLCGGGQRALV